MGIITSLRIWKKIAIIMEKEISKKDIKIAKKMIKELQKLLFLVETIEKEFPESFNIYFDKENIKLLRKESPKVIEFLNLIINNAPGRGVTF